MNRRAREITAELSAEDKSALLNDAVFYEIIFALGVSDHDASDYCAWEHLNFSRMGHARGLIYFFECSEDRRRSARRSPYLRISVFLPVLIRLSLEDRDRLNKDLFHLSSSRLRHSAVSKPWPHTILNRVHERCVEFVQFLLSPELRSEISPIKIAVAGVAQRPAKWTRIANRPLLRARRSRFRMDDWHGQKSWFWFSQTHTFNSKAFPGIPASAPNRIMAENIRTFSRPPFSAAFCLLPV